jgi:peptide chain release factor 1
VWLTARLRNLTLRFPLPSPQLTKQQDEVSGRRSAQIGSGGRSEKIRTYNWKDSRCTDHRLGQNFPLQMFLDGNLAEIINQCLLMEQQEKLEQLQLQKA